jgi:hypothetical protein
MAGTEDRYEKLQGENPESEAPEQPTLAPVGELPDQPSLEEVLDEGNRVGTGPAPEGGR